MKIKKTYTEFIKESFDSELLPVGSKIQFKFDSGIKKCEIIEHKTNINNEIFYLIKLEDGSEEYIVPGDKRIIQDFIKESIEYIDEKTIKDIFIDLIDMDFTLTFVTNSITIKDKGAKYFIDLKKTVDSKYDYIENDFSYGVSNLEPMKLDITKVLDILQSAKETLNSMEYTIGYEIEFNFNDQSQFYVSCHIQHNDTIDDVDDNKFDRNMDDGLGDEDPRGMDEY